MERKEPVPDKKAKRLRVMKIIQTVLTVAVNVFFVMYLSMIIKLAASEGGFTKTSAENSRSLPVPTVFTFSWG